MAADANLQQRLFNPAITRARTRGEMPFDKWLGQPGVAYHGTFREDWESAPYAHLGTEAAATDRLHNVSGQVQSPVERAHYYAGENLGEDYGMDWEPETQEHTGRVYARRLDVSSAGPYSDLQANSAQYNAMRKEGYEHWEIPKSVVESSAAGSPSVPKPSRAIIKEATHEMGRGLAIPYHNVTEGGPATWGVRGGQNISFVVPRGSTTSWESDVLASPHASVSAQQFAQQRRERGEEGAVPFEGAEPFKSSYGWQTSISGRNSGHTVKGPAPRISKLQFTTED